MGLNSSIRHEAENPQLFVLAVEDGDKSPKSLADFLRGHIGVIQITIRNEDTNMITSTEFDFTTLLHQLRSPIPLRTK